MRVNICQICDFASVDASGKTSLIGIFDQVQATAFPAMLAAFSVYFHAVTEPSDNIALGSDVDITLVIEAVGNEVEPLFHVQAKGQAIGSQGVQTPAPPDSGEFKILMQCQGVIVKRAGQYEAKVSINGTRVASVPFTVVLLEEKPN